MEVYERQGAKSIKKWIFHQLIYLAYRLSSASRVCPLPFFISLPPTLLRSYGMTRNKKVGLANPKACQAEVFSPKKRRLELTSHQLGKFAPGNRFFRFFLRSAQVNMESHYNILDRSVLWNRLRNSGACHIACKRSWKMKYSFRRVSILCVLQLYLKRTMKRV